MMEGEQFLGKSMGAAEILMWVSYGIDKQGKELAIAV